MHVVVFTNGRFRDGELVKKVLSEADLIIAADKGAEVALALGLTPSVVIGDFDSLDPVIKTKLEREGVDMIRHPARKDSTDTGLALDYAISKGARHITLIGATEGDRLDHILANVFLAACQKVPVRLVDGNTQAWAQLGPYETKVLGAKGNRLSLIPLSREVTDIRTDGLEYGLYGETLSMSRSGRGVSNVMTQKQASVSWQEGLLLLVLDVHPE